MFDNHHSTYWYYTLYITSQLIKSIFLDGWFFTKNNTCTCITILQSIKLNFPRFFCVIIISYSRLTFNMRHIHNFITRPPIKAASKMIDFSPVNLPLLYHSDFSFHRSLMIFPVLCQQSLWGIAMILPNCINFPHNISLLMFDLS